MAASGYLPVHSQNKRKKVMSSYCSTFIAWKNGDDRALDRLMAQGYDRLFMPKAERLARTLPPVSDNHPQKLLKRTWYAIADLGNRDQLQSFSEFLAYFQGELERHAAIQLSA